MGRVAELVDASGYTVQRVNWTGCSLKLQVRFLPLLLTLEEHNMEQLLPLAVRELSDDELRIRVAEFCGWKNIHIRKPTIDPSLVGLQDGKFDGRYGYIPEYTKDLNAMHEAEKVLSSREDRLSYLTNLCTITGDGDVGGSVLDTITATARQRAEAFVLTLNCQQPKEKI